MVQTLNPSSSASLLQSHHTDTPCFEIYWPLLLLAILLLWYLDGILQWNKRKLEPVAPNGLSFTIPRPLCATIFIYLNAAWCIERQNVANRIFGMYDTIHKLNSLDDTLGIFILKWTKNPIINLSLSQASPCASVHAKQVIFNVSINACILYLVV